MVEAVADSYCKRGGWEGKNVSPRLVKGKNEFQGENEP